MKVIEHTHPCDRTNFWVHWDRYCMGPWLMWETLTFNGPRALAGPQIGGADGVQS